MACGSTHFGLSLIRRASTRLGERESSHATRDDDRLQVVRHTVLRLVDHFAHEHHRDDLRALEEHLEREANVFERRVLSPAGDGVGERAGREVPQRRRELHGAMRLESEQGRHDDGEEAVRKDAERGRGEDPVGHERRGLELGGHDLLLHDPPCQIGGLEPDEAQRQVRDALGLGRLRGHPAGGRGRSVGRVQHPLILHRVELLVASAGGAAALDVHRLHGTARSSEVGNQRGGCDRTFRSLVCGRG
mmetsp:Transcript_56600/g.156653  ORF Transcript_56600/g.156653 Transcript_56600/m.156653 type:complete len:247 (-) Transcript_56600:39-779(-)